MLAWSDSLKCFWESARPIGDYAIRIDLPKHSCSDMRGAIKAATAIMPTVRRIEVYTDGMPSSHYEQNDKGWWEAYNVRVATTSQRPSSA